MKPKISIGSLGGTISMQTEVVGEGIIPKLNAQDFIKALPGIEDIAQIQAEGLFSIPSGHMRFEELLSALKWAKIQVAAGSNGVILTQGTDTLEESAFFCDLFWNEKAPLILMGAMRNPDSIGAEGARNVYNSILCACSKNSENRGVLVVMNDTIHSARWVRKSHSLRVDTFYSEGKTQGFIAEGRVEYFSPPFLEKRKIFSLPQITSKKVFLWEQSLSDDPDVLDWAGKNYDGIVISGYGAGHTSQKIADVISKLKIPIIVCTRTTDGPTAYRTYGYLGSEIDLQKRGVIMGNWLPARKARLVLWVILNNSLLTKEFEEYIKTLVY